MEVTPLVPWMGPKAGVDVLERQKYLASTGIQIPGRPARSVVTTELSRLQAEVPVPTKRRDPLPLQETRMMNSSTVNASRVDYHVPSSEEVLIIKQWWCWW